VKQISERQRVILGFIRTCVSENGRSPTVREIGGACGISSTSHVAHHLRQLQAAGYLDRVDAISRGVTVKGGRWVLPGDTVNVVVDGQVVEATFVLV
jgi:repressor LexA